MNVQFVKSVLNKNIPEINIGLLMNSKMAVFKVVENLNLRFSRRHVIGTNCVSKSRGRK